VLVCFSILYLLFGILAGGDILRIIFLGFPFIMTAILQSLQKENMHLILISFVLSLPLFKLRSIIPDPVSDWSNFIEWYPEYASVLMVMIWLAYGVICAVVLFFAKRHYEHRKIN